MDKIRNIDAQTSDIQTYKSLLRGIKRWIRKIERTRWENCEEDERREQEIERNVTAMHALRSEKSMLSSNIDKLRELTKPLKVEIEKIKREEMKKWDFWIKS